MTADFLTKIISDKKESVKRRKAMLGDKQTLLNNSRLTRYHLFKKAITKPGRINLIAEIKKASPSRGIIREDFDILKLAKTYQQAGADALSILTEEKFFLGKPNYIPQVIEEVSLPILQKDFFIDEIQIYDAFRLCASAVLLIVAILTDDELRRFLKLANDLDMDALVEVHDERELERALQAGAEIIGINNRDLRTFNVDLKTAERLIPKVAPGKIIVVESGLSSAEEIKRFNDLNANAVLIGETFMREEDIAKKVKEVMGR